MDILTRSQRVLEDERGTIAIVVTVMFVALIGFVAITVDVGALYERRRQVQTAVDGGALGGAQELPDQINATQVAVNYLEKNTIIDGSGATITFPNSYTITVTAAPEYVDYIFAPVLGVNGASVTATATAQVVNIDRFVPWAVVMDSLTPEQLNGSVDVLLKCGSQQQTTGNFQSITIPRSDITGAGPTYQTNISQGTEEVLVVGELYDTFPGNRPSDLTQGLTLAGDPPGLLTQYHDGHTSVYDPPGNDSVTIDNCPIDEVFDFAAGTNNIVTRIKEPLCPRLVRVPIVTGWPTGSAAVEIIDFRYFFITSPPPPDSGQIFEAQGKLLDLQGTTRPRRIELID